MQIAGYRGRFAPSPSGPLHFGSLVCALASYLDAKQHNGKWLVRIEDIDPPREELGADKRILQCLETHGLTWDETVQYQSTHSQRYNETLQRLQEKQLTYPCQCTRKRLKTLANSYDQHCLHNPCTYEVGKTSLRLNVTASDSPHHIIKFADAIQGEIVEDFSLTSGDFTIHRKDGLFAYQLAVVVDDIDQGITHIVRGNDLLEATAHQIYLFKTLGNTVPHYAHIPIIVNKDGNKLSKQNHAPAVDNKKTLDNLIHAAKALAMHPHNKVDYESIEDLLAHLTKLWSLKKLNQLTGTSKQETQLPIEAHQI